MRLTEIEKQLKRRRAAWPGKIVRPDGRPLQIAPIRNVEDGESYFVRTLLSYISCVNMGLTVNGQEVRTVPELGAFLASLREQAGWNKSKISRVTGITITNVNRLEGGSGFSRDTMLRYIKALPVKVEYNLIDYGILNTEDTETAER